ncbi:MAG TPA: hypothetical protein VGV89_09370 [Thermoplasmata archaeon]|nr:hypothetical protein [Thermoplasmata archaeon]
MRSLTDAEARVLAILLADESAGERERLRQGGVARSTFHAARRRAYTEGWVRDRYVPSPTLFGFPEVSFALARPFADRAQELTERWAREPGNVVLWAGPRLAFGVFFHRTAEARRTAELHLRDPSLSSGAQMLSPRVDDLDVPVYFDLEGAWSSVAGSPGSRHYPRGLPKLPEAVRTGGSAIWTPRTMWAARQLLQRPFLRSPDGDGGHLVGPFGLPSSQKRLIAEGWVYHRVLAEPARIPEYAGRRADRIVFVAGLRRPGVPPEGLFATLTRESRVFPFVFAYDDRALLLGFVARSTPAEIGPPGGTADRRPVMPTLLQALEGIEIYEEAAASVQMVTDHRYDRLVSEPPGSTAPRGG